MAEQEPQKRNLKVSVENFGPIREGSVELKPLTIFIGPNNTGKSYMALLVYALMQTFLRTASRPMDWLDPSDEEVWRFMRELQEWVRGADPALGDLLLRETPEVTQAALRGLFGKALNGFQTRFESSLLDYLSADNLNSLRRSSRTKQSMRIGLNLDTEIGELIDMRERNLPKRLDFASFLPPTDSLSLALSTVRRIYRGTYFRVYPQIPEEDNIGEPTFFILVNALREFFKWYGGPSGDVHYLPAGRSILMQSWPAFASAAIRASRSYVGREPSELQSFPSIASEFLQDLFERVYAQRFNEPNPILSTALQILETNLIVGSVSVQETKQRAITFLYESGQLSIPLQRASSMVGELAPLALWIKHVLQPGDVLIIDEPEAHLHLEAQRQVASVIARLVHAGVRVLITTHSSYIVHQISNHLLAGETTAKRRAKLGFTDDDILGYDDVGVYRFVPRRDGVHIRSVPVERGWGIHEDEFTRVATAIGNQTFDLMAPSLGGEEASEPA